MKRLFLFQSCSGFALELATRRLAGLICLLWALPAVQTGTAATISAASPAYADVSAAVERAVSGDTVLIPAGRATWTGQFILTKTVTLKGAGMHETVITSAINQSLQGIRPLIYVNASGQWRITGIGFDGNWEAGGGKGIVVGGGNGRIDRCYFYRCSDRGVQAYTPSGLIDHCVFRDCWASTGFYADQFASWQRPLGLGTVNAWVVEDCYDVKTGAYYTPVGSDGGQGARYVWRFNVTSNIGLSNFDYTLDAHGNQGSPFGSSTANAGTVFLEAYGNLSSAIKANRGTYLRGGTQIHYNNTFFAQSGNFATFCSAFMVTEEDGYRVGNPIVTEWPAYHQITNSYFFANTLNGKPVADVVHSFDSDRKFIQNGRDYFLRPPSPSFYRPLRYPHPRVLLDNDPPLPSVFALSAPSDGAVVSTTPGLQWVSSAGATAYVVEVASDYYFSEILHTVVVPQGVTAYSVPSGVLAGNQDYYWRSRAVGDNGKVDAGTREIAHVFRFNTSGSTSGGSGSDVRPSPPTNLRVLAP